MAEICKENNKFVVRICVTCVAVVVKDCGAAIQISALSECDR
jgi:hypothetical protein